MSKTRIIYYVPELSALSSGILHSQVLTPASFISGKGFECIFIGAEPTENNAKKAQQKIESLYQLKSTIYTSSSGKIPYFNYTFLSKKVLSLARIQIHQFKPDFIYVRNHYNIPVLKGIAKEIGTKLVLDMRGIISEESALKHGKKMKYFFLLYKELAAIKKADRLSCVSTNLQKWIYNNTGRDDVIVIPSCVDIKKFGFNKTARDILRKKFGISENEIVFCYSGGLGKWQKIDSIIKLFAQISKKHSQSRFFFITQHKENLEKLLIDSKIQLNRYLIISCEHSNLSEYLSSCDIGVIMRDDTIVNNVASPVKIAEYLSCGLPVILTTGIGNYSHTLPEAGVGILLNDKQNNVDKITDFITQNDLELIKKRSISFTKENISWQAHLKSLQRLFSNHNK
jgi:glycosyltransferase involved in cell wall biosynthesis